MKGFLFLLILIPLLPIRSFSQWKRENGFTLGVISPDYPKERFSDRVPGVMIKLGFAQSWYPPDKKISFRPEVGLNAEILSVDVSNGGLAAGNYYEGTIININGSLAALAQICTLGGTTLAFGPSCKYIITNIYQMTHSGYCNVQSICSGYTPEDIEYHGVSRKYLKKPSIGIRAMLIQKTLNEKLRMGLVFDYQWKNSEEDYFYFSRTMEISLYLGLH